MPVAGMVRYRLGLILLLELLAVLLSPTFASSEEPLARLLGRRGRDGHRDHQPLFRADVNLVLVPVTVTDRNGRSVQGLEREDFRVYEEKLRQQIVSFSTEDAPCSVGLVFDTSGSMGDKVDKARLATRAFSEIANPQDEAFLVTFADRPELRTDFTPDFAEIQNSLLFIKPRGSTALVDGVYLALRQMRSGHNTRRALLIVSDGGDNHSRYGERDLKPILLESDVQVYAIGIHDNPRSHEEQNGTFLLEDLSSLTGGLHFELRDMNELSDTVAKIGVALHNQYVIGYRPRGDGPPGKWRRIRVELKGPRDLPPLRVYARSGYYTAER